MPTKSKKAAKARNRIKISKLPKAAKELTAREQQDVKGGDLGLPNPPPPPPPPPAHKLEEFAKGIAKVGL